MDTLSKFGRRPGSRDDEGGSRHRPVSGARRVHLRRAADLRARRRGSDPLGLEPGRRPARQGAPGGEGLPGLGDQGDRVASAPMEQVVVVGASLAGLRAAEAVREQGHDGALVVVGEETHPPYTRPPLSKQLLAGAMEREKVDLRWREVDARWRLGVRADGLDPHRRRVVLAGGEQLPYDGLVVATGGRPRQWPRAGELPPGVFTLRHVEDALALREALRRGGPLVVVGAGFIGCEVAATARSLGVEVVQCDIARTPMASLGPELGAACAALQLDHGVELVLGRGVERFEVDGAGRLARVVLANGAAVEAEVALVALGALPNVGWLGGS